MKTIISAIMTTRVQLFAAKEVVGIKELFKLSIIIIAIVHCLVPSFVLFSAAVAATDTETFINGHHLSQLNHQRHHHHNKHHTGHNKRQPIGSPELSTIEQNVVEMLLAKREQEQDLDRTNQRLRKRRRLSRHATSEKHNSLDQNKHEHHSHKCRLRHCTNRELSISDTTTTKTTTTFHSHRHGYNRAAQLADSSYVSGMGVGGVGGDTGSMTLDARTTDSKLRQLAQASVAKRFKLTKRETLDMVVNRLHILESLDEQLRAFTEAASLAQQHRAAAAAATNHHHHHHHHHDDDDDHTSLHWHEINASQYEQIYCQLRLVAPPPLSPEAALNGAGDLANDNDNDNDDDDNDDGSRSGAVQQQNASSTSAAAANFCLTNKNLLKQIPPYMLNLYRQLWYELHEQQQQQQQHQASNSSSKPVASAVQLMSMMPYKAQIMRTFRQPKILPSNLNNSTLFSSADHSPATSSDYDQGQSNIPRLKHDQDHDHDTDRWRRRTAAESASFGNVVVELSVLPDRALSEELQQTSGTRASENEINENNNNDDMRRNGWRPTKSTINDENDGHDDEHDDENGGKHGDSRRNKSPLNTRSRSPVGACSFKQRLLPAHKREELCFWFNLSENFEPTPASSLNDSTFEFKLGRRQNGASGETITQSDTKWARTAPKERLVEAELHVFKLFPQLLLEQQYLPANQTTTTTTTTTANNAANFYHLKTNLLEVNLYQILPRRKTTTKRTSSASSGRTELNGKNDSRNISGGGDATSDQDEGEYPLRLLDIRRIDLNSNGWETFYVKRAVEDWLRDAQLNLGLVIKAKSMFDEPIKIGLIRFADAYDHYRYYHSSKPLLSSSSKLTSPLAQANGQAAVGRGAASTASKIRSASSRRLATTTVHLDQQQQQQQQQLGDKRPISGRGDPVPAPPLPLSEIDRRQARAMRDFDSSHQPLLVIYTKSATAPETGTALQGE